MKKKNIIIIAAAVIAAVLVIIGFVKNTTSDKRSGIISGTPEASSGTQTLAPNASSSPAGTVTTSPATTPAAEEKYKSDSIKDFNISFKMPEDWKKITGYDNRYEGKSGFIEFTVLSGYGLSLKEAVDLQINNESKTFGEKPETKNITIDSQEAAIIYSTDKASTAQCAVLIKFPKAITISSTPYNYLLVWSDRGHIDNLAKEIKFNK